MDALFGVTDPGADRAATSTFIDADVITVDPLRVRLDGDATELPFAPDSLVDPLALLAGDRVRCELSSRRVIVVGRAGGSREYTRTSTAVTSSLANNAEWQGTITLASAFVLLRLTTTAASRVRVYASNAYRTADSSRAVGVLPSGDHGLIFEGTTESGALSYVISPAAVGGNLDSGSAVAVSVQNRSGATRVVEVGFTWR